MIFLFVKFSHGIVHFNDFVIVDEFFIEKFIDDECFFYKYVHSLFLSCFFIILQEILSFWYWNSQKRHLPLYKLRWMVWNPHGATYTNIQLKWSNIFSCSICGCCPTTYVRLTTRLKIFVCASPVRERYWQQLLVSVNNESKKI